MTECACSFVRLYRGITLLGSDDHSRGYGTPGRTQCLRDCIGLHLLDPAVPSDVTTHDFLPEIKPTVTQQIFPDTFAEWLNDSNQNII